MIVLLAEKRARGETHYVRCAEAMAQPDLLNRSSKDQRDGNVYRSHQVATELLESRRMSKSSEGLVSGSSGCFRVLKRSDEHLGNQESIVLSDLNRRHGEAVSSLV